jgi:hypothetical protein
MSKKKSKTELATKPASGIALAATWPVHDVQLSRDWNRESALASVLIARQSLKTGRVAAGLFLVDLACLGIKSAQVRIYNDAREYRSELVAHAARLQPMMSADFNLAAKILYTGLEYAAQFGFKPDPVFIQAEPLLTGADPDAVATPVPTGGPDGKPHYINGPHDDPARIIAQLQRTAGDGNFHYTLQGDASSFGFK